MIQVYPTLTDEEKARNTTGPHRLFVSTRHPVYEAFKELYASESESCFFEIETFRV